MEKDNSGAWEIESEFDDPELAKFGIPTKYHCRTLEQSQETSHETGTIRAVSINKKIDPKLFKVIGMDLPPGTPVMLPGLEGMKYWDGKALVDAQAYEFKDKVEAIKSEEVRARGDLLRIAIVAVGIALLCSCFLMFRRYRAKK